MIYTCFEMIQDCRADKAEGWRHLVMNYVPVMRRIAARYAPNVDRDQFVELALKSLRQPGAALFKSLEPSPERWFIATLRQEMLRQLPPASPEIPVDLETVGKALDPLTVTQKLAEWIESMGYNAAETGAMLRMA